MWESHRDLRNLSVQYILLHNSGRVRLLQLRWIYSTSGKRSLKRFDASKEVSPLGIVIAEALRNLESEVEINRRIYGVFCVILRISKSHA